MVQWQGRYHFMAVGGMGMSALAKILAQRGISVSGCIEISPIYKWNCDYPENESEYETFDNFLNNYKPIDIVSIDRSVAERWLDFCCDMIKIFKENDKKYLKEDNTN